MRGSWRRRYLLPLSLGIADGIVNALILASSAVLHNTGLTVGLGLRVGAVGLISAVFTIYVAEYAQLRAELTRAERQLNLTAAGRLATSNLGRQVAREAALAALIASVASFLGAFLPLLVGVLVPAYTWVALGVSVLALGALGASLATAVRGNRIRWTIAMVVMGTAVALAGVALDIT